MHIAAYRRSPSHTSADHGLPPTAARSFRSLINTRVPFARRTPDFCNPRLLECAPITRIPTLYRLSHGAGKRRPHKHLAHKRLSHKHVCVCVSGLWTPRTLRAETTASASTCREVILQKVNINRRYATSCFSQLNRNICFINQK